MSPNLARLLARAHALHDQAVADRLGLHVTDLKCLDLAASSAESDPMTPGRLAELTGLTTGAITSVLDRLERGGFVRRVKDPSDRRQVRILVGSRGLDVHEIYTPLRVEWDALHEGHSPETLGAIQTFLERWRSAVEASTAEIRAASREGRAGASSDALSAPLAGTIAAKLVLRGGLAEVRVGDGPGGLLYDVRFEGKPPSVARQGDEIRIAQAHGFLRRSGGTIELHPSVRWTIVIQGGASRVELDARALHVEALEISGGASELAIRLGAAEGTVPITVRGGASQLTIARPEGVAARLRVAQGASGLAIDRLRLGSVGGETKWASPDYDTARDRYDVEVNGGASDLTFGVDQA